MIVKMRGLIALISAMVTLAVSGQNYFADGTKWYTEVWGTHDPTATAHLQVVSLERSDADDCLKMYLEYPDNETAKQCIADVKVDGDKVFFRLPDCNLPDWYLMYDFGLTPGEGCYVYDLQTAQANAAPRASYLKCVDIVPEYLNDVTAMFMEEYEDEACTMCFGNGTWLKGLSSAKGVLFSQFGITGIGSKLIKITHNDVPVYTSDPSGTASIADDNSANIKIDGNYVTVSVNKDMTGSLYTQSGLHIGDYSIQKPATTIELPGSGIYILNIDGESKKLFVP